MECKSGRDRGIKADVGGCLSSPISHECGNLFRVAAPPGPQRGADCEQLLAQPSLQGVSGVSISSADRAICGRDSRTDPRAWGLGTALLFAARSGKRRALLSRGLHRPRVRPGELKLLGPEERPSRIAKHKRAD